MKKGFTLIELIGVIVILVAVILVAVPIVDKTIKDGKKKMYEEQIDNLELSAQNWLSENTSIKIEDGDTLTLTLWQLKQEGFVDADIKNSSTDKFFANDMLITISRTNGILQYNVSPTEVENQTDVNYPTITLNGKAFEKVNLSPTAPYVDLGATAQNSAGTNLQNIVVSPTNISLTTPGIHIITYSVTDSNVTSKIIRTIKVVDIEPPKITMTSNHLEIFDNEVVSNNLLSGVSASDNGGQVTLTTESNVSIVLGTYTVKYIATDSSGNIATKTRTVTVKKSGNPIFILQPKRINIGEGDSYNLMSGVSAKDTNGYSISNITCKINGSTCGSTTGLAQGTYTLSYTATDKDNKTTTVTRTLVVSSSGGFHPGHSGGN